MKEVIKPCLCGAKPKILKYDWEIQDKCKECGAFVDNAKPLERVIVYQESTQSYESEVQNENI